MERLFSIAFVAMLTATIAHAQTSDLVFFTDDGTKFTLIIDGDVKNETPATRVIATDIRTETPMLMIKFEDPSIEPMKKPGWFEFGKEHTVMITTNKKGQRVLRPTGEAELGTAAAAEPKPEKPAVFVDDTPSTTNTSTTGTTTGGVGATTTVTVVEETTTDGTGENVNFNMGVNGIGVDMNINVNDGMGGSTTSHTTTTTTYTQTTTTTGGTMPTAETPVKPVKEPEVYRMPGYSGRIGCAWPMNEGEFNDAKSSIESKGFEETKLSTAKQIGRDRCFTVAQVKGIVETFNFEDSRLDFAKFAYDRTYDIDNYYKVSDAFNFSSSTDELNTYIQSR